MEQNHTEIHTDKERLRLRTSKRKNENKKINNTSNQKNYLADKNMLRQSQKERLTNIHTVGQTQGDKYEKGGKENETQYVNIKKQVNNLHSRLQTSRVLSNCKDTERENATEIMRK